MAQEQVVKSRIKDENYVTIQGFMVNQLQLKGNELLIYSIIYGFSQGAGQKFNGSLQYLADWTNSTKQGVIKSLKGLCDKGYIVKNEVYKNDVKFCEYYATELNTLLNKVEYPIKQSLIPPIKQSLPNNISLDNIEDNIDYKYIVDYLNKKAHTNYRYKTLSTQKHINARVKEGYTVKDFETVIDKKCNEWLGTEYEMYLAPDTLFSTKFEKYLNQKVKGQKNGTDKKGDKFNFKGIVEL